MSKQTNEVFFGLSAEADFSRDNWSFEMDPGYKVRAGRYAIVPALAYAEIMQQRDELLSAARAAETVLAKQKWLPGSTDPEVIALARLRAAIACAEGREVTQ